MSRVQVPSVTPVLGPGSPFIRRLGLDYNLFASFSTQQYQSSKSSTGLNSFKQVYALLAQLAEQRTLNPQVLGSIPRERTIEHQVRRGKVTRDTWPELSSSILVICWLLRPDVRLCFVMKLPESERKGSADANLMGIIFSI
jgi:hypothetical protein